MTFDPSAAAASDSGIFGLPHLRDEARIVILPVPFEATTSYGGGTSKGPKAILKASRQVDLLDHRFGNVHEQGIFMLPMPRGISDLSRDMRELAEPIIERGGAGPKDAKALARIDKAGERVRSLTRAFAEEVLAEGKVPVVLGGDHSTPLGQIEAVAGARPGVGVLQIDAHMDLRDAFEGFRYSHASIMRNVLELAPGVSRLVQVGIRDFCAEERDYAAAQGERVRVFYDDDLAEAQFSGESWSRTVARILEPLPREVYVSVDIDGLDPSLCPGTGTPVPGGLSFRAFSALLAGLKASGRTILGFDLVEVSPGKGDWDANVGARVLYRLCGMASTR